MLGVNKVIVMGHMTRDPELKYTPNGQAVASFGVATNRRWSTPEGEKREEVEFHNIVAWGRAGEVINQYLKKGSPIYVEGRLKTQNWEGSDGIKRSRTEIVVENFQFVSTGNQGAPGGYGAPTQGGYGHQASQGTSANNFSGPAADANNQNNPSDSGMASPADNAANSSYNTSSDMGQNGSNSPIQDDPFAGNNEEKKPDIGNPEDISIDDIPF